MEASLMTWAVLLEKSWTWSPIIGLIAGGGVGKAPTVLRWIAPRK